MGSVRNTCQLFFESFLVLWRRRTYYLDIVSCNVFASSCVIFSIPLAFLPLVRIDSNYLLQVTCCIAIISWLSIILRSFFCMILCGLVRQRCWLFGLVMTVWTINTRPVGSKQDIIQSSIFSLQKPILFRVILCSFLCRLTSTNKRIVSVWRGGAELWIF